MSSFSRRFSLVALFPVAVLLLARCVGQQAPEKAPPTPGIKTDLAVYPEPPLPELPKAGGTYVDPTFGTTIMRLTDESDGKQCQNAYSYWPSFNRDSTRLFANCAGAATLFRFDPDAFKLLGKEPLFAKKPPSGFEPRWESAAWSDKDPDVLFCHQGLNLWAYNVAAETYELVKDFAKELPPGHLCQMSKSLDDNTFAFSLQDPKWHVTSFLAWRRDQDKVILQEGLPSEGLDEVQVDNTGRYLVIKHQKQGKGVIQVRVADLETGKQERLTDDGPDFAPGHSDNGRGSVIGADNFRNCLTFRKLAAPHEHYKVLDRHNDWSQDNHISLTADDDGWVLLSFYVGNGLPCSGVFRNEIVQVATDGSQRLRRLAHHRSDFLATKDYWDSPRANISRDGRFVVYTSNWGAGGRRDVFVLKVPPAGQRQ
jgi:hypothetical protein